jgi:hypothetical protein
MRRPWMLITLLFVVMVSGTLAEVTWRRRGGKGRLFVNPEHMSGSRNGASGADKPWSMRQDIRFVPPSALAENDLGHLFTGVPHVIHIDPNRWKDYLMNRNISGKLEDELTQAGMCPGRCTRVTALPDKEIGMFKQGDGAMVYQHNGLSIVTWAPLDGADHLWPPTDRRAISRFHAHLRAILTALMLGHEWVVVLEADADLSRALLCGGRTIQDLVSALPQDSWRILQVGTT